MKAKQRKAGEFDYRVLTLEETKQLHAILVKLEATRGGNRNPQEINSSPDGSDGGQVPNPKEPAPTE